MSELVSPVPSPSELPQARRRHHRWLVILLLLGLVLTVVLSTFAGGAQTVTLLLNANLFFVACLILFQILRYAAMALSLRIVAKIVSIVVPFVLLFQVVVAAQAANRTFVGGAAGLAVRLAFFLKRGMGSGTFVAVEGIEDSVSLAAVALMFVSGIGFVMASGAASEFGWELVGVLLVGVVLVLAIVVTILRNRAWVEAAADGGARFIQSSVGRIAGRDFYEAARVRSGVDDLYRSLALAGNDPTRVTISFLCALARLGCDWIALYFAYLAVGYEVALGTVLLIFVVSTSIATLAAVPGQIGVMETALAFMSTTLGIPAPIAVSASILFRVISFWLPVPFGYAFAWNLERNDML